MKLNILALIVILTSAISFSQTPNRIIVGTTYNVFHNEYRTNKDFFKEVDSDFNLMKASNLNYVMIFPMSRWNSSTQKHTWTRTDYMVKKIEDLHMKFVPLMLKEEQCAYYFPIWKFKEIPGMWKKNNLDNGNKNNDENVDFADPKIYPLVDDYFKAVIKRYGNSPALGFYNIWNEPHYYSNAKHVVASYRKWLKKKYGSLKTLRRIWGKDYTNWNQVSPFLNDNWNSSMPQIDWTLFMNDYNGMLLAKLRHTLRKYDTTHAVNANPVGTPWAYFKKFGGYNQDNWAIADNDDIHGISYYPDAWERNHNLQPCPFWLHNLTFNTIRCASGKKNYILTELFTNTQNGLALNGYLTKNFVTDLAWTALANNCKGMIYWKWLPFKRGRQSLGRGLCKVDGSLAPRGEAVKKLGAVMKKYGKILFKAQIKKPQAAILLDMVGLQKTLEQSTERLTNKFMYQSNAGLFKALYEKNISVDVLRMDRKIDLQKLKSYKILFLPFQIVMRRKIADLLKEYVKEGGCLIADARTATIDEQDFAYKVSPGAGLDSLFGAKRPDWKGSKSFYKIKMNKEFNSLEFAGKYFREQLKLYSHAKVLGTFEDGNEPAVIENNYGKGKAILSAVPLGASYYNKPDNPVNKLIVDFCKEAGVRPYAEFSSKDGFINLKVHKLGNDYILYAINSDNISKNGTIQLSIGNKKIESVNNIISNNKMGFEQNQNILSIPAKFNKNQVMVFYIK